MNPIYKIITTAAVCIPFTQTLYANPEVKKEVIDKTEQARKESITNGQYSVFYEKELKQYALKRLTRMGEMKGFASGFGGVNLINGFGEYLMTKEGPITLKQLAIPTTIDPSTGKISALHDWVVMHEWVEASMMIRTRAYSQDRHLRFVGDGLAELFAYEFCLTNNNPTGIRERLEANLSCLEQLKKEGVKHLNLAVNFPSSQPNDKTGDETLKNKKLFEVAGYPASLVFWHQLYSKHGNAKIKEFHQWFIENDDRSVEKSMAKLEQLTGSKPELNLSIDEIHQYIKNLDTKAETVLKQNASTEQMRQALLKQGIPHEVVDMAVANLKRRGLNKIPEGMKYLFPNFFSFVVLTCFDSGAGEASGKLRFARVLSLEASCCQNSCRLYGRAGFCCPDISM